jgi:membrane protease YdiL (CAAX protease family)
VTRTPGAAHDRARWAVPAFVLWAVLALLALVPVALVLESAFPILTVAWILVPLLVVARTRDAGRVGIRMPPLRLLAQTTALNLAIASALMVIVEPWSHTYDRLLEMATTMQPIDSTFAWIVRYPRLLGLAAMTVYAGAVTMFGEELFFRGWLLQYLRRRMRTSWAIVVQAALFAIPQMLVAAFMSPVQAVLYVVVYAWLSVGVVGGWADARTSSIWPSLITVTVGNLILVALLT